MGPAVSVLLAPNNKIYLKKNRIIKVGFGYDNSVSLQTDDAGHVGAAILTHMAYVVGLQTNDVLRN